MNKKISLGAAIAYMAIVAAVAVSLTIIWSMNEFNDRVNNIGERETMYNKLAEIDRMVRDNYYGSLDENALRDASAKGYLSGLGDPYAQYLTAKEYETYNKKSDGKYVGIGVVAELDNDGYIKLKEVYPESPAEVAGLKAGDLIVSVDGETATAENYETLVSTFKGEAGTKITLVKRQDNEDSQIEITRRAIDIPTIKASLLEGGHGYIRITGLTSTTASQFDKYLNKLLADGALSLTFDVRGLQSDNAKYITDMLDVLLPKGPVLYAEYRDGGKEVLASSDEKEVTVPMAVLIDETTKGTPELFAQALKDSGKAKSVGANTAGKGTLQKDKKLSDGSAVVYTIARYAGPSGVSYDKVGVPPDFDVRWGSNADERATAIGNPEVDAALKKAMEYLSTALKTENAAGISGSSSSSK